MVHCDDADIVNAMLLWCMFEHIATLCCCGHNDMHVHATTQCVGGRGHAYTQNVAVMW